MDFVSRLRPELGTREGSRSTRAVDDVAAVDRPSALRSDGCSPRNTKTLAGHRMEAGQTQIASAIADSLSELGCAAVADDHTVTLATWSTVCIDVVHSSAERHPDGSVVLHTNVHFFLNRSRSDSLVRTCSTGLGASIDAASLDAALMWTKTEAPPLLSVLFQEP